MMGFSVSNYVAELCLAAPRLVLPLLILHLLGSEPTAYFYIAWAVSSIIFGQVPRAIHLSLFAEGAHREETLVANVAKSLKLALAILVPATILTFFLADKVLVLFGAEYAEEAYVHKQDAEAAGWIGSLIDGRTRVFADLGGGQTLNSQGLVSPLQYTSPYQIYYRYSRLAEPNEGYVYLRYYSIVDGRVVDVDERDIHESSWYLEVFNSANRLYDNGSSQILFIRERCFLGE